MSFFLLRYFISGVRVKRNLAIFSEYLLKLFAWADQRFKSNYLKSEYNVLASKYNYTLPSPIFTKVSIPRLLIILLFSIVTATPAAKFLN